jgi:hypothetical protein
MLLGLLTLAAGTSRPAGAAQSEAVSLTVYNQNFALVKDVRVLELVRGNQEVRLDDVAALIDPTSVHFEALEHPGDVTVTEQNFQYDLAGADRLLSRYLNREVTAVLKDGTTRDGTLLSFDGASLVLGMEEGASILNRAEVRDVVLGELPGGIVVKPTLVWTLASDRVGSERAEVSYLTDGVNWHAEYVAVVNQKDTGLTLDGWVSLDNQSGASYRNARLKLVAGDVHRVQPPMPKRMEREMDMMAAAGQQFEEREFFEYHVYTLERPATVADRETKQISLIPTATASAKKVLSFDGAQNPKVQVKLEFENDAANGLGIALPAGKVRVYKEDADGALEFVGEDAVQHTPRDETVRLILGNAFDLVGERKQTAHERVSERVMEQSFEIELRNHKDEDVEVIVVEHLYGDWKLIRNSHDHRKKDAFTLEFPVTVPARGEVTVTYTARVTW